jgi:hypothetical protein
MSEEEEVCASYPYSNLETKFTKLSKTLRFLKMKKMSYQEKTCIWNIRVAFLWAFI